VNIRVPTHTKKNTLKYTNGGLIIEFIHKDPNYYLYNFHLSVHDRIFLNPSTITRSMAHTKPDDHEGKGYKFSHKNSREKHEKDAHEQQMKDARELTQSVLELRCNGKNKRYKGYKTIKFDLYFNPNHNHFPIHGKMYEIIITDTIYILNRFLFNREIYHKGSKSKKFDREVPVRKVEECNEFELVPLDSDRNGEPLIVANVNQDSIIWGNRDDVEISADDNLKISAGDDVEISADDNLKISAGDDVEISAGDDVEISAGDDVEISAEDEISADDADNAVDADNLILSMSGVTLNNDNTTGKKRNKKGNSKKGGRRKTYKRKRST
jgi:hypothetical protein